MRTFVLVGDPASIANTLNEIYKNNPKLKPLFGTASHHIMQQPQKMIIQGAAPGGFMAVQCYYLTYTGVDVVVDANGKPLEGAN